MSDRRRSVLDRNLRYSSSTLLPESEGMRAKGEESPEETPAVYPTAHPSKKREPKPVKEKVDYSVVELCRVWGLRISGKDFTNPITPATHAERSPAEEAGQIVDYVESTPGFFDAEPVLRHIYILGKDPETYDPREPGQPFQVAIGIHIGMGRKSWRRYPWLQLAEVGPAVHARFLKALLTRMDEDPFEFIYIPADDGSGPVTEGEIKQIENLQKEKAKSA